MFKKITTIFLIIFIFLFSYIKTTGDIYIESNDKNVDSIIIEDLIPKRGELNIISSPEIKISYKSKHPLDDFKLFLNYNDITKKTKVTSKYIYYKCDRKLKRGVQVVRLEIYQNNNPEVLEWYFTVGTPFYNHYRGIFFNNVNEPNIFTSYDDLNKLYKNTKHYDYVFITEKFYSNKKNNHDDVISNKKWNKLVNCCNKYGDKSDFISIPGFQLSTRLKNEKNPTKINIFNCNNPFVFKDNINLELLYKKLFYFQDDLLAQFSPDDNLNNINYFKYSSYGDEIICLIELKHSNKNVLNLNPYKEALDNGWHVSPIACEFNGYLNPNSSNNFITTILCEYLSKSEILNGIKNRRIYVSENKNIDVNFTLNKMPMGSIVKNPSYIRIIASAINSKGRAKIKKIQIYGNNNKIIYSKDFKSTFTKVDFILKPSNKNTYYFAVITDENNKKSITSPIWVEY
ncbi:hypothetical protein [Terrisporobacter sp.]